MGLEGLIGQNKILIYFVGIFYIMINESFNKHQKIVMIYTFTYCFKLFNIMESKIMMIILFIVSYLYMEFLTKDDVKNQILNSTIFKIKDYFYKIIFEYSAIYFLISMIFISDFIFIKIPILSKSNITIPLLGITINVISIIFLIKTFKNITSQKYETNTFKDIKSMMDKIAIWSKTKKLSLKDKTKLEMLVDIEDKSYFIRKNTYNFLNLEFLKYKLKKETINVKKILYTLNKKNFKTKLKTILFKKIYIKENFKNIRRYVRGYSTIEMQLIRTLGVKYGYKNIICRKAYEIIYSKIFFKSLRKYMNDFYFDTMGCVNFKEYLLLIYIEIAPIKINGKRYNNMLEIWNTNKLSEVTKEQFFISILGLSNRHIDDNIIDNYINIVNKYNLDIEELSTIIERI